jgi:HD superfamily phosphohydrolase
MPEEKKEKLKKFRDPIYGYIEVPCSFVSTFIDTPCFQRLRYVIQTSYTPVYMAALHNRFTHSLGVYHLGKIVYRQIRSFLTDSNDRFKFKPDSLDWINTHEDIFLAACLLHDVGHAPFSHTGEMFYDEGGGFYAPLYDAVNDAHFRQDAENRKLIKEANAHERMSVLSALQNFKAYFDPLEPDDRGFFARCITGYTYNDTSTEINQIKNCVIKLLNSSLIDVDRLDYIIRDAFMSGYQNVSIDYNRLLGGMVIARKDSNIILAYHKSAMSVIEHTIFAHDCERKWLQNNPVIAYETFLLDHCIRNVQRFFDKKGGGNHPLFSLSSLNETGNTFGPLFENDETQAILNISLLCDADILYYIKNVSSCQDVLTREFFDRNSRRHPLWKSEEEYKYFLDGVKENKDYVYETFSKIVEILRKHSVLPIINENVLNDFRKKIDAGTQPGTKTTSVFKEIQETIVYFEILKKFAMDAEIAFDFVIIPADLFKSNFSKIEVNNIMIFYPYDSDEKTTAKKMESILKTGQGQEMTGKFGDKFFYFYFKRKDNQKIPVSKITRLCNEIAETHIELNLPK